MVNFNLAVLGSVSTIPTSAKVDIRGRVLKLFRGRVLLHRYTSIKVATDLYGYAANLYIYIFGTGKK